VENISFKIFIFRPGSLQNPLPHQSQPWARSRLHVLRRLTLISLRRNCGPLTRLWLSGHFTFLQTLYLS